MKIKLDASDMVEKVIIWLVFLVLITSLGSCVAGNVASIVSVFK